MLWVLFVWARDAGNVESAYQSSELAVLQAWQLLKVDLGHDTAASREAGETFNELVELHFGIFDEMVSAKILPHVDKRHAISMAVGSSSPVDINLKMFDLAGRIALNILWRLWRQPDNPPLPSVRGECGDALVSDLTQGLVHLIRNNPSLLAPMQDAQSIEIALGLMAFTMQENWQQAGANWIEALIDNIIFNFRSHGRYPTIEASYRELLRHPREKTDEYRKDKTAGSTIIPLLRLWETKLPSRKPDRLAQFSTEHLAHCNCQLWFPDEDSEERIYAGDDRHGSMLNGVPVGEDLSAAWEAVDGECKDHPHFQSLSAIDMQHWPVVLMACRHYRIPVPPNLWIDLVRPESS